MSDDLTADTDFGDYLKELNEQIEQTNRKKSDLPPPTTGTSARSDSSNTAAAPAGSSASTDRFWIWSAPVAATTLVEGTKTKQPTTGSASTAAGQNSTSGSSADAQRQDGSA
ncbi:hypothetical protein IAR55_005628 [Kwoniella newhampshirensis]|uniref:Uncharacterized protein n=1 Tax=Kwoniella newhampshirensis TaxID=1651941 RepID=A0AAW0YVA6_9TREE